MIAPILRENDPAHCDPHAADPDDAFLDMDAFIDWLSEPGAPNVDRHWIGRLAYYFTAFAWDHEVARRATPRELLCLALIDHEPVVRLAALDAIKVRYLEQKQ